MLRATGRESTMTTTIETRIVRTAPGMDFDVSVAGDPSRPLVLMLHGFCVSRHYWEAQVAALAEAGYFAAAPNQRGYAPGARPPAAQHANYTIDALIDDAMAIVSGLGHGDRRFHLAGHDWGGSLSWDIADRWPERLGSLSMLSRPHPLAFNRALQEDPEQPARSAHHKWLLAPGAEDNVLADDAHWVRARLHRNGVPEAAIEKHISVIGNHPAMEAAIGWYRARGTRHAPVGPTRVPTLLIWGDADDTVGRMAAEGTAEFIAAPYTFAELPGVGHYAADQVPDKVNTLILAHLARHPV
jgi:pimeloyl-ACP methyl ester carboxylesterase